MGKKHVKTYSNRYWSNTIKNYTVKPKKYIFPKDHSEIVDIILEAEKENIKVRAVGSGHSFSNVAFVKDGNYIINTSKLDKVRPIVDYILKEEFQNTPLVWVQSGVTIHNLNKELDILGFSITNMGGIDHQTISGAISTGTHGTGLNVPSVHGMVRAIQIITTEGERLQFEAEFGITKDELLYNGDFKIVRDNDTFQAALVSLGAMGIIYAFILRVESNYWLKEVNEVVPWSKVKLLLEERTLLQKYRGVKIIISPYSGLSKTNPQDYTCVISTHSILYKPKKVSLADMCRNLISNIFSNWMLLRTLGFTTVQNYSKKHPEKMPKVIEIALNNQKDKGYVQTAHKVLYQGGDYLKERAYDCEVAFDLKDDTFIRVIEALIANAIKLRESNIYHTSPIGIRFVQRSDAFMSPDYQRDVCYIDSPMLLGSKNEKAVINASLKLMLKMGGTPHWGKINDELIHHKKDLEKIYPGLKKWKKVVAHYNRKNTFTSNLMEDIINDEDAIV